MRGISLPVAGSYFLAFCFLFASCSIPNLETPACIEARTPIREFFSFHFGNEMRFSPEGLKLRERFLTADLMQRLSNWPNAGDPFTTGDEDLPKAFRVGSCREIAENEAEFEVLLFWRDDVRSEQRAISVATLKQDGRWLIADVNR